jgi:CheY-like chemotaxis protein
MQGTAGVTDNPEGGSIFYFSIPLEAQASVATEEKLDICAQAKVLVVDDNPHYLQNIASIIANHTNLEVATAISGEIALQMIREAAKQHQEFSLVLMDMGMPTMDGWRLAAEINKDPAINGVKLYLMIPEGQLGGEAKMKLLSWFNGYLYKPVQRKKLIDLLINAFDQPLELPTVEKLDVQDFATVSKLTKNPTLTQEQIPHPTSHEEQVPQKETLPREKEPQVNFQFPSPIIAVDDHPVNLKILTTFLASFGVQAHGALSGQDAITLVQQHPETKIVFMDIEMPFMNGFETSKKMRANGYEGIIIACSANSTPDIIEEYITAGINDYFAKPFKKQQLAQLLEKWQKLPHKGANELWNGPK